MKHQLLVQIIFLFLGLFTQTVCSASSAPDSLPHSLVLINIQSGRSLYYQIGEELYVWEKRPVMEQENSSRRYRTRKISGTLQEVRPDSILINQEWISIAFLSHITKPGKGKRKRIQGIRATLLIVPLLISLALIVFALMFLINFDVDLFEILLGVSQPFFVLSLLSVSFFPRVKIGKHFRLITTPSQSSSE